MRRDFAGELRLTASGNRLKLVAGGASFTFTQPVSVAPSPGRPWLTLALGDNPTALAYRGILRIWAEAGTLTVVNELPFEDYVRGVVSNEIFAFGGLEAFKTQAVISRTFALYEARCGGRHPHGIDVCATGLHCQEYRGMLTETSWGNEATAATAGKVLTHQGRIICAYYHDNGGGHTETPHAAGWLTKGQPAIPYLASIPSPWDEAGLLLAGFEWCYSWTPAMDAAVRAVYGDRTIVTSDDLRQRLRQYGKLDVGPVQEVRIRERTPSGRVSKLEVVGEQGEAIIEGTDDWVRKVLRTPSSLITRIEKKDGAFHFSGKGRAHGVGLSQQGAMGIALEDYHYREILGYYYRGVSLTSGYGSDLEAAQLLSTPESLSGAAGRAGDL